MDLKAIVLDPVDNASRLVQKHRSHFCIGFTLNVCLWHVLTCRVYFFFCVIYRSGRGWR
jgi:hypothetical protein